MKKHKKTIEATRDREADLKTLADAFFRDLLCTTTKRGKDVYKLEPEAFSTSTADYVLNEIQLDESTCEECGSVVNDEVEFSDEAKAYAEELWFELGAYMSEKWATLTQPENVCEQCGDEVTIDEDEEGPFTCVECSETEEEADEDDSEDDSEDAEDVCSECGCEMDDCDCDEDSEEEEDETVDVECSECGADAEECECDEVECPECGTYLDDDGVCSSCDEEE